MCYDHIRLDGLLDKVDKLLVVESCISQRVICKVYTI